MKKIISPKQKATIALEAVKEVKTANQLGSEFEVHPISIGLWKKQLIENAHVIFSGERKETEREQKELIERLYQTIGKRETELDWLKKKLHLES
jgi:transposase-like protein